MSNPEGSLVAVDCGTGGYFQGLLSRVDQPNKQIVLDRALRDGVPLGRSITLEMSTIKDVKILTQPKDSSTKLLPVAAPTSQWQEKAKGQQTTVTTRSKINEKPLERKTFLRKPTATFIPATSETHHPVTFSSTSSSSDEADTSPPLHQPHPRQYNWKPPAASAKGKYKNRVPGNTHSTNRVVYLGTSSYGEGSAPNRKAIRTGDPLKDGATRMRRCDRQNSALTGPIDFDLDEEFDFEANHLLFDREELEGEEYSGEEWEEEKGSGKRKGFFSHDENIISDPQRCTTWTTKRAAAAAEGNNLSAVAMNAIRKGDIHDSTFIPHAQPSFVPASQQKTLDGHILPVFSDEDKAKLIEEAMNYHGEYAFFLLLADRLLQWTLDVAQRCRLSLSYIGLFGSETTPPPLIENLELMFENRGSAITKSGDKLPGIAQVLIVLSKDLPDSLWAWIQKSDAHIIALDFSPTQLPAHRVHVLASCALNTSLLSASAQPRAGPTTFAMLAGLAPSINSLDMAACDLHLPFTWFASDPDIRKQLAETFATKLLVRI